MNMNKPTLIAILAAGTVLAGAITIGDWQNIRCSGKTSADQVFVRLENPESLAADNKLLYYNGTQISESDFAAYGTGTDSYQASYTQAGANYELGLVAASGGQTRKVNPVYYGGSGLPALGQMTRLSTDPANDQSINHLDIVADYFTFSDTKFYGAIQNRGGGFPQTGALGFPPYYSYMVVMANPASDPSDPNTIVFAMNYMSVVFAGISPGLFKITGTGSDDLIRIGDISTEVVSGSNLLKMSCNISDLLADSDFSSWYNANGHVIGVVSLTSRTTLNGLTPVTEDMDTSPGAKVYPTRLQNMLNPSLLPQIDQFGLSISPGDVRFSARYQDSQGRFPLSIQAEWLPGQSFSLQPQSNDHSQPVTYQSGNLSGILNEYDDVPARAAASLDNINWAYSPSQELSYILGLEEPAQITAQYGAGSVELVWDPVDQTLLGNPVEPDRYHVEADTDPLFPSPRQLDPVFDTSATIPLTEAKEFYRVRAVKDLP